MAAQPVRPDLTEILAKADFSRKVLIADGKEHCINAALVAERIQLPADGCATQKDAAKLTEAYFTERFSQKQSSEYYTRHAKTEELRRRYEWVMQCLFMHAKGDRVPKTCMCFLAKAEETEPVNWAQVFVDRLWDFIG